MINLSRSKLATDHGIKLEAGYTHKLPAAPVKLNTTPPQAPSKSPPKSIIKNNQNQTVNNNSGKQQLQFQTTDPDILQIPNLNTQTPVSGNIPPKDTITQIIEQKLKQIQTAKLFLGINIMSLVSTEDLAVNVIKIKLIVYQTPL